MAMNIISSILSVFLIHSRGMPGGEGRGEGREERRGQVDGGREGKIGGKR